ncbi:MAG: pullulanase-type alpha-1,6-glucosidase [Anaerolineales bacterium]|nr:pullulanase-type alpha-1,6-glucosidase [Anaerolineales bacterium]
MRLAYRALNLLTILALLCALAPAAAPAAAADTPDPEMVVVPGTLQSKLGCSGDWQTDCANTALVLNAQTGLWEGTFTLPAGSYEYKIALNGTWAENYGLGGQRDGPNIPLVLAEEAAVTFTYDHETHAITDSVNGGGAAIELPQPERVVIPGTLQSELGCPGDWQPDCAASELVYDAEDGVWQGTFLVQPGNDQDKKGSRYKATLNGTWAENYGQGGQSGGADIALVVDQPTEVKFYYDHRSHWVADNFNTRIVTAIGDFQTQLGCAQAGDPGCLRSWLQDPDGDGLFTFSTRALKAGTYQAQAALGEALDEVYGGPDGPVAFTVAADGDEIFFGFDGARNALIVSTTGAPKGDLSKAHAHWVKRDTLMWQVEKPAEGTAFRLYYSPTGGLAITPDGITGGEYLTLQFSFGGLTADLLPKFPQLKDGFFPLKLAAADLPKVPELLRGQVAVAEVDPDGRLLDATSVQIPGVLDNLYTYSGPLGVVYVGDVPTLRVWAPTARNVALHLYADSQTTAETVVPLTLDPATGVWSAVGTPAWTGQFYLYEVEVYVPATGQVEHNLVTDPYSFSLSLNSTRSQIVNLADPALAPPGWAELPAPALAAPEDSVIYELHVRDFSANDATVPEEWRGTFKAFTVADSAGMKHLQALAAAGLTHVHLLPAFDLASINEDKRAWQTPDPAALAALPGDSDQQQALISNVRDQDGFNWGYDPYHYTTPEGSYATQPDGATRILEFREMVQALHQIGLRVVMDVVYNHTNASGQGAKSVLDKVVPGYYHRLNADGFIERSTCCENTATEHAMMEKLMVDSVRTWAAAYKVDGFRFDLMGHHMLRNMVAVRAALDALTPAANGVDGRAVYVYGEGWDFGEVAGNKLGRNAAQLNLGGTGIGVFNDRLRDAARGGGPFGDPREQGFLTGLFTAPSGFDQGTPDEQRQKLLRYMDWIRVGLAGNLSQYKFVDAAGRPVTGADVDYNGAPAGYTLDPQENIVYISAHDNETLFDAIQWKAPISATLADRGRMNNLGLSLVLLSQGVPFFHAGDDLLRSKSLDRNSYNSGDWFNKLDFTYQTNNWAVGLPSEGSDRWDLMRPLLADPALQAAPADIAAAHAHFLEWLQLRRSSPLFRLRTAADVQARLAFLNTGPEQIPGLIVMTLDDRAGGDLDPEHELIVVLFNAAAEAVTFADAGLQGLDLALHPLLAQSADALVRTAAYDPAGGAFTVPGRTAAVFVLPQTAAESAAALAATVTAVPLPATATLPPLPTATPQPTATRPAPTATAASVSVAATATATVPAPRSAPAGADLALPLALALVGALAVIVYLARRARA